MIKQLLNSVIAKYRDLSLSRRSIICFGQRLGQIIDLLASDKSRYFSESRPIIVNYLLRNSATTAIRFGVATRIIRNCSTIESFDKRNIEYQSYLTHQGHNPVSVKQFDRARSISRNEMLSP